MNARTPLVVVIAGPNGAGKSTSARTLLQGPLAVDEFVNADTIATGLSAYQPESVALAAGRVMLERLRQLEEDRRNFAFETTLAGRGHATRLRELRSAGYRAHLIFLALLNPSVAIARVAARVRAGGHHVPDDVVQRRFAAGIRNLFAYYLPVVDAWQVHDSSGLGPRLVAGASDAGAPEIVDASTWKRLQELNS